MSNSRSILEWPRTHWLELSIVASLFVITLAVLLLVLEGLITASHASLIATLLLVVLTAGYAATTYRMTNETKKARVQETRPVLDFQPDEFMSTIVNLGGGPARSIDITLSFQPVDDRRRIQRQSLPAGEKIALVEEPFSSIGDRRFGDVQLQYSDLEEPENDSELAETMYENPPAERLQMEGSCEDVWGTEYTIEEEYMVYDLTEGFGDAVPPTMDESQSLETIALELQRIRSQFEDNEVN